MFEDLIRGWDGEFVASRFDELSSTWMSSACTPPRSGRASAARHKIYRAGRHRSRWSPISACVHEPSTAVGGGNVRAGGPRSPTATRGSELLKRCRTSSRRWRRDYVHRVRHEYHRGDMTSSGPCRPRDGAGSGCRGLRHVSSRHRRWCLPRDPRRSARALRWDDPRAGRSWSKGPERSVDRSRLLADEPPRATLVVSDVVADRRRKAVAVRVGAHRGTGRMRRTPCAISSPPCATGVLIADIRALRCRVRRRRCDNQLSRCLSDADRLAAATSVRAELHRERRGVPPPGGNYQQLPGWTPKR